jgi:hypothetical protein
MSVGAAAAARTERGRAGGPGLGRARSRPTFVALVVSALVLLVGLAGCGSPTRTYGASGFDPKFPSFLPKKSLDAKVDQVLVGTAARPALSVEGGPIEVRTPAWSVLAVVSGPVVPGEGLPYQPAFTTCTWTVTLSHATAAVPVAVADFDSVDHLGNLYHPTFVEGQPRPASVVEPGQTVTFQIRAYEAVGEGVMRWAPIDQKIVAMWDFEVEND